MTKNSEKEPRKEKSVSEELAALRREFETMMSIFKRSVRKMDEYVLLSTQRMDEFSENLQRVMQTNQAAEETLLNVLVAIRQNEYLQAWTPAQHGYDAIKIAGPHPAKIAGPIEKTKKDGWRA